MSFRAASVLVALTGFIALSLELVWIRQYYFLSATRAFAFSFLLCSYLLGLALGSLWSIRVQKKFENGTPAEQSGSVARLVLWANVAGFLLTPLVSWIAALRMAPTTTDQTPGAVVWFVKALWDHLPSFPNWMPAWSYTYPLVAVAAAWLGTLLPLICHFSVPPDAKVGSRLSKLYLSNIVGSGVGSLLTGFVLMEYIPLRWICFLLLALGVVIYIVLSGRSRESIKRGVIILAVAATAVPALFWQFWERMQDDQPWGSGEGFTQIVESRSGVITVDKKDKIYGGGTYDGVISTTTVGSPWLVRAYSLSAIHPNPEEVLVIGLSGGAWVQITAANPYVKHIICVEINHSYREVIASHPVVASLLKNPKIEIVIDDGRRWLERNPDRKFDAILMNTTQHYREYASNLLSREYLQLAARHMKPGGVFQYNATGSLRVHQTALEVFDHVMLLLNNLVIWKDEPQWDTARWRNVLEHYQIDGKLVFDPSNPEAAQTLNRMLTLAQTPGKEPDELKNVPGYPKGDTLDEKKDRQSYRLQNRAQIERACRKENADAITDDNLGHEYRWWQ
jgi:spermidine synthase